MVVVYGSTKIVKKIKVLLVLCNAVIVIFGVTALEINDNVLTYGCVGECLWLV